MTHALFYNGFLIHKNLHIASVLMEQLDQGEQSVAVIKQKKASKYFDFNSYELALKTQIRGLSLNSIDTLFEILFALKPEMKPFELKFDKDIVRRILNSNQKKFNEFIADTALEIDRLSWLDAEMESGFTVGEYLFYFGVSKKLKEEINIDECVSNIKICLNSLAKYLVDKSELNAFKHGDRIFPLLKGLIMVNNKTGDGHEVDFGDGFTYFRKDYQDSKKTIVQFVKANRLSDYQRILLVSQLIENMIDTRRYVFGDKTQASKINIFSEQLMSNLHEK